MGGHDDLISSLYTSITYVISLDDDHQVKALGKGVVSIITKQDIVKKNYDVYYVPNLKNNLLSVG